MKAKELKDKCFIIIPILVLLIISLINMFFVSKTMDGYQNYLFKQALWFGLGFLVLVIFTLLKSKIFFKYSKYLYFINVLLLILVLFFGTTVNGSKAWFQFPFFSFQPSELMKFSLTLYLSNILAGAKKNNMKDEFKIILKALFITLIPSLFVFLEPDTGAIIIYFIILLGMILAYKINYKWYLLLAILLIGLVGAFGYLYYFVQDLLIDLIGTSFFYRVDRLLSFVNNDSFQLDRALISIGTAKFFGTSKGVYIPEAPTDFIVAYSISKLGIFSFIIILVSFLVLDIYFFIKLFKTKIIKHKLFIAGFLAMFIFAQIQNIGMNLGVLPIIGLPLPFVSYGGTNIIVYFMFLGILMNLEDRFKK